MNPENEMGNPHSFYHDFTFGNRDFFHVVVFHHNNFFACYVVDSIFVNTFNENIFS
jgi:hypothetical protein